MDSLDSEKKPFGIEKTTELFTDKTVYYSGSIRGTIIDPMAGFELVKYMLLNGASVSSAHVAARSKEEMKEVFQYMSGRGLNDDGSISISRDMAYEVDMGWVDQATHLVALVDGASHGVGMEISRALHKPFRGLNVTPVLCLVHEDNYEQLSFMLAGAFIDKDFGHNIKVVKYKSIEDAEDKIRDFLLQNNEV